MKKLRFDVAPSERRGRVVACIPATNNEQPGEHLCNVGYVLALARDRLARAPFPSAGKTTMLLLASMMQLAADLAAASSRR